MGGAAELLTTGKQELLLYARTLTCKRSTLGWISNGRQEMLYLSSLTSPTPPPPPPHTHTGSSQPHRHPLHSHTLHTITAAGIGHPHTLHTPPHTPQQDPTHAHTAQPHFHSRTSCRYKDLVLSTIQPNLTMFNSHDVPYTRPSPFARGERSD